MIQYFFGKKGKIRISLCGLQKLLEDNVIRIMLIIFICFTYILKKYETNFSYRMVLSICLILLIIIECINTIIENIVNRISLRKNNLSKKIKDMSSALTFIIVIFVCFLLIEWFIQEYKEENIDKAFFKDIYHNLFMILLIIIITIIGLYLFRKIFRNIC